MKRFLRISFILMLFVMPLFLSGCRYSDVLQQIIYNMRTDEVHYEAENKPLQNDKNSEDYTEEIKQQEIKEEADREILNENDLKTQDDETLGNDDQTLEQNKKDEDQQDPATDDGVKDDLIASNEQTQKQIVDAYGNYVKVPENIETIAAVGEAATIIRMLGGIERLIAADAAFVNNERIRNMWQDIAECEIFWQDNSNQPMNDAEFEKLLSAAPQACVELSGHSTYSDYQIEKLKENNIFYVVLPALKDYESIKETVTLIGKILGDRSDDGGANAPAKAKEYCDWVDSAIAEVAKKLDNINAKTKYTLFIPLWDDNASYSILGSELKIKEGKGAAITYIGYYGNTISALMSDGGVINTASLYSSSRTTKSQYVFGFNPYKHYIDVDGRYKLCELKVLDADENHLGSSVFPALVVVSNDVKSKLEQDDMWQLYDIVKSSDGNFTGRGFLDKEGVIVNSSIDAEFDIFVNPDGVGSWWKGSAESILQMFWAAGCFHGIYTEDELQEKISEFYQKFYGYELSAKEIEDILDGE